MRQKIDYGIDLGTTNSAIARIERGEAVIIKSDDNQMDTTPSGVAFRKNRSVFVGLLAQEATRAEATVAYRQKRTSKPNSYLEFKRTMGTDHQYLSSYMDRSFSSEELSAEVLKKLRGYVREESVDAVVVTVPAMFRQNQLDATQHAAELAGFKYCELLQEPIAASIAYGVKADAADGHWLVFDFGGCTFDAVETGGAINSPLFTKRTGATITVDVLALNGAALNTNSNDSVVAQLVLGSGSGCSAVTAVSNAVTINFVPANGGRRQRQRHASDQSREWAVRYPGRFHGGL